jgi:hypothetical protein
MAAHPDFVVPAADAVKLVFVRGRPVQVRLPALAAEAEAGSGPHRPLFTHQLFRHEKIFGYRNPVILVAYSDPDLSLSVTATFDGVMSKGTSDVPADALDVCLRSALPEGYPAETIVRRALPTSAATAGDAASFYPPATDAATASLSIPPGSFVLRYTLGSEAFVIHRWDLSTPALRAYHDRMSTLAMWYIESKC